MKITIESTDKITSLEIREGELKEQRKPTIEIAAIPLRLIL